MSTAPTISYPAPNEQRSRRRRAKIVVSIAIVAVTLICGIIAADRIADFTAERRIADALKPYGDADVSVVGFPVLGQLAGGRLDEVRISSDSVTVNDMTFSDVTATAFDAPIDRSRPIGTLEASAVLTTATLNEMAADRSSLPDGMTLETSEGEFGVKGTFLGQELFVTLKPEVEARRVTVSATAVRLGSVEVDLSRIPDFLISAIGEYSIDLGFLPAGLEVTGITPVDTGLRVELHGTGVALR